MLQEKYCRKKHVDMLQTPLTVAMIPLFSVSPERWNLNEFPKYHNLFCIFCDDYKPEWMTDVKYLSS